jgi:hypothetical protein
MNYFLYPPLYPLQRGTKQMLSPFGGGRGRISRIK